MKALQRYDWPGNIRELRNVVERAMILAQDPPFDWSWRRAKGPVTDEVRTLEEIEKRHIIDVMEETGWRVRGKDGAAEILGPQADDPGIEDAEARHEAETAEDSEISDQSPKFRGLYPSRPTLPGRIRPAIIYCFRQLRSYPRLLFFWHDS